MVRCHVVALGAVLVMALSLFGCEKPPEPGAGGAETASAVKAGPSATSAPTTAATTAVASDVPAPPPELLAIDKANEQAPEKFKAKFVTSQGDFVIEVTRAWAPRGADRFYNLVKIGFFNDVVFFRVVKDFVVQFGIHGNPKVSAAWRGATMMDEAVKESNKRGYITYAKGGPDTRTTQVFINLKDNDSLDKMGFPPFGKVTEGMDIVEKLYSVYGEELTKQQAQIQQEGNNFLKRDYPKLDYIKTATIVK
jgi:peptidyl-prolyl cis-trans isomerase A (cyclophilin A)